MRKIVVPGKTERAATPRPRDPGEGGGRARLGLRYGGAPPAEECREP